MQVQALNAAGNVIGTSRGHQGRPAPRRRGRAAHRPDQRGHGSPGAHREVRELGIEKPRLTRGPGQLEALEACSETRAERLSARLLECPIAQEGLPTGALARRQHGFELARWRRTRAITPPRPSGRAARCRPPRSPPAERHRKPHPAVAEAHRELLQPRRPGGRLPRRPPSAGRVRPRALPSEQGSPAAVARERYLSRSQAEAPPRIPRTAARASTIRVRLSGSITRSRALAPRARAASGPARSEAGVRAGSATHSSTVPPASSSPTVGDPSGELAPSCRLRGAPIAWKPPSTCRISPVIAARVVATAGSRRRRRPGAASRVSQPSGACARHSAGELARSPGCRRRRSSRAAPPRRG